VRKLFFDALRIFFNSCFFLLLLYCYYFNLGILDAIRSVQPPGGWKVVVVDEASLKIIESACKMFDILEEKVTCKSISFYFILNKNFRLTNKRYFCSLLSGRKS
jgi:hypothetical protein